MDAVAMQALLADLSKAVGVVSKPRRPHGFWTPYAWAVRALVTMKGMSVIDAAKIVLRNAGLTVTTADVACVRVVYYKIRDMQWPEGMQEALMGAMEVGGITKEEPEDEIITEPEADVTEEESTEEEDSPIPDDLRAELEQEVATGFLDPEADEGYVDPDADPDFQP